jgi:glycosyltransferase involved in cell wall biosynthesis
MKILYLYSELSPYLQPIFQALVNTYGAELHVVHWDYSKLTPYKPYPMDKVYYYNRSEHDLSKLKKLRGLINPDLIFVAGWMDIDYLKIVYRFRSEGGLVVVVFDDIWRGSLRQKIGSLLIKFIGKYFFSHAFVSFSRQYEYAKKFGFNDENIIFNALSCDTELFHQSLIDIKDKINNYPQIFIYAGRFSKEKGIQNLVDAFKIYRDKFGGKWRLICVGGGNLHHLLEAEDSIEIIDFLSQEDLLSLFKKSGVFVMPSLLDMCPLAVHEATSACLPIILSSNVGNKSTFLIDGYNGLSFESSSPVGLASAMSRLSSKSDSDLFKMGMNSYSLSTRVTPNITAASLVSIIGN